MSSIRAPGRARPGSGHLISGHLSGRNLLIHRKGANAMEAARLSDPDPHKSCFEVAAFRGLDYAVQTARGNPRGMIKPYW
jgi:hypothetical protein